MRTKQENWLIKTRKLHVEEKMKEKFKKILKSLVEGTKQYFKNIKENPVKKVTVISFFVAPILVNIVIEVLNKRSLFKCLGSIVVDFPTFMVNYFIVLFTMSIVLLMSKRLAGIVAVSAVWIGLGIANFILKSFRETPFSFSDIRLAGSVMDIIDKYLNPFSLMLIIAMICLAILAIIGLYIKVPRYDKKINPFRNIIFIAISFLVMVGAMNVGEKFGWVSERFPNMTIAYKEYGFVYCFANSVVKVGVEKPDVYSKELLEEIVSRIHSEETVDEGKVETPNIIFLQLESFFDVNKVKDLELSEEATPIFNQLKKDFPSGYLTVNNVGYGTANTEFEVMTGMNLDDFGPGEFPYKTVLQDNTCESMSFILRDYGYVTHAMHNNTGTFYARNLVFKNLGFDTYTSIEYMYPEEYTPLNWVKDTILTDEIIKVLDSTEEQDYLYAISVQGHGSYPTSSVIENPTIQISGIEDESRAYQFEYYVNQIKEMDDFIGELTAALSEYDEDTILVMYGDHLPSLDLAEEELENANLYQTEYIIWSNYGLQLDDKDIETFELGSRVMQALNIDGGVINKFHQIYEDEDNYLSALTTLEYDILYGDQYVFDGQTPYIATDMMMGTYEITIKDVVKDEGQFNYIIDNNELQYTDSAVDNDNGRGIEDELDEDGNPIDRGNQGDEDTTEEETTGEEDPDLDNYYIVIGENFTKYSRVYINGEMYSTEFIDSTKLRVYISNINSLDTFTVKQYYKGKILSKTKDYTYIVATLPEDTLPAGHDEVRKSEDVENQ